MPNLEYQCPPENSRQLLAALYSGQVVRFRDLSEMAAIVAFTRAFVEERLAPFPPIEIHRHIVAEPLAKQLSQIQSEYSRSGEAGRLWAAFFESVGLEPHDTARDRLALRFQVHADCGSTLPWSRSTATVGFHRDTWGTNLAAQVNWWAPVWPITAGRTFAIYPRLWEVPVANNSVDFDLADVMERLRSAPETLGPGQLAPRPTQRIDPDEGVPVVLEPGQIIAFSSAHAHAGVANHTGLTRVSLETRTVSVSDVRTGRGAPDMDGHARWVAPGLFRRLSDGTPLNAVLGCERLVPRDFLSRYP